MFPWVLCYRSIRSCDRRRRGSFRYIHDHGPLEHRWVDIRSIRFAALLPASESRAQPFAAIPNLTTSSGPTWGQCLATTGASSTKKRLHRHLLQPISTINNK